MPSDQDRMRRRRQQAPRHSDARGRPQQTRWERWRARLLAWGAVAGALAAIVGLWPAITALLPKPDPENAAVINSVHVASPIPISQQRARRSSLDESNGSVGSAHVSLIVDGEEHSVQLVADGSQTEGPPPDGGEPANELGGAQPGHGGDGSGDGSGGGEPDGPGGGSGGGEPDDPGDGSSGSDGTVGDEGADVESSESPASSDDEGAEPAGDDDDSDDPPDELHDRQEQRDDGVTHSTPEDVRRMRPPVRKALARKQLLAPCRQRPRPQRAKCRQRVVDRSLNLLGGVGTLGPNGDPLPPAKVADALVEFFRDVRTVETPIGGGEAIEEPVGASVVVNVELSGLRGQAVDLLWEIYEAGGDRGSLFGRWLSSTPAYRLEPSTDHDTTSAALWIPLPPDESRYYVQLTLLTNGTPLYTSVSEQFR